MSDLASEFYLEAEELFNEAEEALLRLEENGSFEAEYVNLFRSFHSLKGASGMLGFLKLQKHMHVLETNLSNIKVNGEITTDQLTYFLKGIDFGKKAMLNEAGAEVFDMEFPSDNSILNIVQGKPDDKEVEYAGDIKEHIKCLENESPETLEAYKNVIDNFNKVSNFNNINERKARIEAENDKPIFEIAIIDDEVDILEILNDFFIDKNVKVHIFSSFTDFKESYSSTNVDVVLTDFKMPDHDGLDVLKFVRSKSPFLPVIFLSGFLDKNIIIKALGDGVSGVIEKPIQFNNVYAQTKQNALKYKTLKLLNRSIDLLIFNYKNYDDYLKSVNKTDERIFLKDEVKNILQLKKQIFSLVG
jgi:CheY-like chemotaxis protein